MTTATVHAKQSTRPDSITLDSWHNILFVVQEPDRHGNTVWNVRLSLGELPPWRYGPFETNAEAKDAFKVITEYLAHALWEHAVEAGNRAGCDSNEEH